MAYEVKDAVFLVNSSGTELTPATATNIVLAAGNNNIGDVDLASAIPAGTALIGKVGIDQTTPGTTNRVDVGTINGAGGNDEYETVAASQTAQPLGATGATGDDLEGVLVIPATTSPGNVLLLDNATSITIFTGGASSVSNLVPFFIPIRAKSVSGAWKITTGANVSVIGIGNFT